MPFAMQPAQFKQGGWPNGVDRTPGSDQTYPRGTPVTWDTTSQELDEHAGLTTVTNIFGVSMDGVSSGTAQNPSGKVCTALAHNENIFMAKLTNGSGTVQTVDTANLNVQYGMLKNGSGLSQWWSVDEDDTTNVVLEVIDIDTDMNIVYFVFLNTAVQLNATYDS
jgi:hypothetical protein